MPDAAVVGGVTATATPVSQRMQAFEFRRTHHQGSGRFLTRSDLEQNHQSALSDLIRRMPGAQIVSNPHSNAKNLASIHTIAPGALIRAAPPCFSQVFVDGVQIYGMTVSTRGSDPPNLDDFHVEDLEAVEYYSSPSSTPPEFRTLTSQCGTLVLWTREAH
jgi:outer membrane receptor for ferrienterochelin and colicin